MGKFKISSVNYNVTYKPIGKHVDGRIFATRHDATNGLYVVDRDLNLVSTINITLPSNINNCIFLSTGTMMAWGTYSSIFSEPTILYRSTDLTYTNFVAVLTLDTSKLFIERSVDVSTIDDTMMCSEYTMAPPNVYGDNRQPPTQNVWRGINDGRDWNIVFTMNRNPTFVGDTEVVRHIHTTCYDPYENKFWIGSGDGADGYNFENKIWFINPDGTGLTLVGEGAVNASTAPRVEWIGQRWRTTAFVFTPTHVIYGSDTNYSQQSWYQRIDRITLQKELLEQNNDCVRITKRIQTTWGEMFISNKSDENGTDNPNNEMRMNICNDMVGGTGWYEAYKWTSGDSSSGSVFYTLIDGRDNRIYGQVYANLLDENGLPVPKTGSFTTVIMDISTVIPEVMYIVPSSMVIKVQREIYFEARDEANNNINSLVDWSVSDINIATIDGGTGLFKATSKIGLVLVSGVNRQNGIQVKVWVAVMSESSTHTSILKGVTKDGEIIAIPLFDSANVTDKIKLQIECTGETKCSKVVDYPMQWNTPVIKINTIDGVKILKSFE